MKPEQQLITIAEACGWRCTAAFKEAVAYWVRPNGMDHETEFIPDYLNDLNAMHEAEKGLTDEQDLEYSEALEQVVEGRFVTNNAEDMRRLRSATASQRAEAFLRTIGKWEESK